MVVSKAVLSTRKVKIMMTYTVKEVAEMAGVSRRTLHYYDEIGLLKPTVVGRNGYRYYQEEAVLRLQQILYFREMDFSLSEIIEMMDRPDFDLLETMKAHRAALQKRAGRLNQLIETIDQTILHLNGELELKAEELFRGFDEETQQAYADEAGRRWGTEKVKASNRRWKSYSTEERRQIMEEAMAIHDDLLAHMEEGHESEAVQAVVGRWYEHIHYFFEPSLEVFRSMGQGYEEDPKFAAFYERLHPEMPGFFRRAIEFYCDETGKK
jgi:DNA-binding transcriptional MerR regulator